MEGSDLGKDEVIKKAWETRDTAVKRKNASEVELARERIAVMQVKTSYMKYLGELFHAVFPFPLSSSAVGDVILVISGDISKKWGGRRSPSP